MAEKLLSREVHAGDATGEILREDHVGGLFDQVSITRLEAGAFQQSRYFSDEARRVEWNLKVVVGAGFQARDGAFGIFLVRSDEQDRDGFQLRVSADLATKLESVHARHRNVADDEVRSLVSRECKALETVFRG